MNRVRITSWVVTTLAIVAGGSVWLWAQPQNFPGPQPALGTLNISPPNIVFNTPTSVRFTILIDTPTLNPTTVELQKVDEQQKVIASFGGMYDNGKSGDTKPGDRIFTTTLSLNEPTVGRTYFRVAAAFRGNKQNAWSSLTSFDIDPFALPPDPREAGKATLAGIDSDKDGVRDDVQRYIAISQADSPATRAALRQVAVSDQTFIMNAGGDIDSILAIEDRRGRANGCLGHIVGLAGRSLSAALRAQLLNTKARSLAYVTADAKLSGRFFPVLKLESASCDFDPANPPN